MNFEDERYVRTFTRKTVGFLMMPWEGRVVMRFLLCEVDRAGVTDMGEDGVEGLAVLLTLPVEVVQTGLQALLKRKAVVQRGTKLVIPNFIHAQECRQSDAARQRAARERRRDHEVNKDLAEEVSRNVTVANDPFATPSHASAPTPALEPESATSKAVARDVRSHNVTGENDFVTDGHTQSRAGHSVLCRTVPYQSPPTPAGAVGEQEPSAPRAESNVIADPDPDPAQGLTPIRSESVGVMLLEDYVDVANRVLGGGFAPDRGSSREIIAAINAATQGAVLTGAETRARLRFSVERYLRSHEKPFDAWTQPKHWRRWIGNGNAASLAQPVPVARSPAKPRVAAPQTPMTPDDRAASAAALARAEAAIARIGQPVTATHDVVPVARGASDA